MKTFQTSVKSLTITLLASTTLLAQSEISARATDEPVAFVSHSAVPTPALTASATNQATKTFGIGLYRVQELMTIRLMMEKKAGEKVTVRLLNPSGQILHQEVVARQTRKYGCNFDFSTIQDGSYTLEIVNGNEVQRKTIKISTATALETPTRTLIAM